MIRLLVNGEAKATLKIFRLCKFGGVCGCWGGDISAEICGGQDVGYVSRGPVTG